jgi:hypothetical protein
MSTKHTPGPWFVGYGTHSCAVYMKPVSEGWLVRDQIARFDRDGNGEGEANAKLIAAAPELLAALKQWADNPDGWNVDQVTAAHALIAKAGA